MSRATNQYQLNGQVKPKSKPLRRFKVEAPKHFMTNFHSCLDNGVYQKMDQAKSIARIEKELVKVNNATLKF